MIGFQHLNSPRHNINYADSMAKAKADSAPGSALGGHHGSMHSGGSIGENLNSYSIPMLNMFLQTLQPPAQNCRYVKIRLKVHPNVPNASLSNLNDFPNPNVPGLI